MPVISHYELVMTPLRYVVGRWNNIPRNTILAFNAADIGLHFLVTNIWMTHAAKNPDWKRENDIPLFVTTRAVTCLAAVYLTSNLTGPLSLEAAFLSSMVPCLVIVEVLLIIQLLSAIAKKATEAAFGKEAVEKLFGKEKK